MTTKQTRRNLTEIKFRTEYLDKKVAFRKADLLGGNQYLYASLNNKQVIHSSKDEILEGVISSVPKSNKRNKFCIDLAVGSVLKDVQKEMVDRGVELYQSLHPEQLHHPGWKCAIKDCFAESDLSKEPCLVCGKLVHHMCSNSIFEGDLNIRISSKNCMVVHSGQKVQQQEELQESQDVQGVNEVNLPQSSTAAPIPIVVNPLLNANRFDKDLMESDVDVTDGEEEETTERDVFEDPIPEDTEDPAEDSEEVTPEQEIQDANDSLPDAPVELDALLTKKALASLPWESNNKITEDASDMCKKNCRVKAEALLCCTSPYEVFMFFFQDTLWNSIVQESNRYRLQHEWGQKIDEIKREEVMKFVGLLIARSLNPWTNGMSNHWRKNATGPFCTGTFGEYLSRRRYKEIVRCLHFADNHHLLESTDKFYKVAPLVHVLNRMFEKAVELSGSVSYDEATIATVSKYVPCKVYNGMKPHKWGIKLHMVW